MRVDAVVPGVSQTGADDILTLILTINNKEANL